MQTLNRIYNKEQIIQYICAGNSTFTIHNIKTNGRFTYKSKQAKSKKLWWIYLLTRENNDLDDNYKFIGAYSHEQGFIHSLKSKITNQALSVISIKWMFDNINTIDRYKNFEFFHAGSCGICGRKLTTPDSLRYGYGRQCMEHGIRNGTIIISDKDMERFNLNEALNMSVGKQTVELQHTECEPIGEVIEVKQEYKTLQITGKINYKQLTLFTNE